jgi:ferritin-like metal-binding protein YciE
MNSPLNQLTAWLNSAYAMEENLAKILESHARDAADFPDFQARLEEHVAETRIHSTRVQECLGLIGQKPSITKSLVGNVTGMLQGAATGLFRDAVVKNALSDYAAEHFEIASYQALIAAAEDANQKEIGEICREILSDEEAMAGWLEQNLPDITRAFLQREAAQVGS